MNTHSSVKPGAPGPVMPVKDVAQFGPWTLTTCSGHILKSTCSHGGCQVEDSYCTVCRYHKLLHLPQLPEMLFADNYLEVRHESGYGLKFTPFDALQLVDYQHDTVKVAVSDAWKDARSDCQYIDNVVKPYDWTYTNNYKGTLFSTEDDEKAIKVSATDERIDVEKLKVQEKIYFYKHVHLFEDELADNGCSTLDVKVRVMADKLFILLRFYLRVDGRLLRMRDTRIYHESEQSYMLREYTSKEALYSQLQHVEPSKLTDPDVVAPYLTVQEQTFERLELPAQQR